jgi:argininosuccinate synthase
MSTTVFSGTEIDALKDRITKLENNATKVEISGEVSVNFTKGNQDDEAEIGIATSIAGGFNSNIVFSGTDQFTFIAKTKTTITVITTPCR